MNYTALNFGMSVLNALGLLLFGLYAWWTNRDKITNARFKMLEEETAEIKADIKNRVGNIPTNCNGHKEMERRADGHNERLAQHKELITEIKTEFQHMPKNHDLEKIYERINKVGAQVSDMKGELGKIAGAMPGITHITEMINDFLLTQGGKR